MTNGSKFLSHDKLNRITTATTLNPGASNFAFSQHRYEMRYSYDGLNRLKDSQYFVVQNYANPSGIYPTEQYREQLSYDLNGNITSLQRKDEQGSIIDYLSYAYAPNSNRLNQLYENVSFTAKTDDAESTGFSYDKNGNVLSGDGTSSILYDLRNLPTQISKNGQTFRFRYNASGQRIYKEGNSGKEHYLMNGSELVAVWTETEGLKYWQTAYGRYEKNGTTYTSYYYVRDHLGSTRVVLNEAGQRTEATDYYAFGMKMAGRSFHLSTKDGYTTKERDAETGWDYFGARYYMPAIGRWNGVDALFEKHPEWTPYNYVLGNPLSLYDPDGKQVNGTRGERVGGWGGGGGSSGGGGASGTWDYISSEDSGILFGSRDVGRPNPRGEAYEEQVGGFFKSIGKNIIKSGIGAYSKEAGYLMAEIDIMLDDKTLVEAKSGEGLGSVEGSLIEKLIVAAAIGSPKVVLIHHMVLSVGDWINTSKQILATLADKYPEVWAKINSGELKLEHLQLGYIPQNQ